jgi:hypothetical protein
MEVHHHPQLEHKSKPWKEYLLEGFMIFVAVTMGFFAESLRERISNREKGHEFVVSLMADLKADTANMDKYFISDYKRKANYKLVLGWLEQPIRNDDTAFRSRFYTAAWTTLNRPRVYFTNRIISQLKNSDNFRLIVNQRVAGAITDYSNGTIACDAQVEVVDHFTMEGSKYALAMMNLGAYKHRFFDYSNKLGDGTVPFKSTDPKIMQDYSNAIYLKVGVERYYTILLKEQQQRAIKLMELLKREYDLE